MLINIGVVKNSINPSHLRPTNGIGIRRDRERYLHRTLSYPRTQVLTRILSYRMAFKENSRTKIGSEAVFEHWAVALLSLFLIHLCYTIISRRWFSPLSKFPGPFWGSITDLYSAYINLSGKLYLVQYDLHKKYGQYTYPIYIGRRLNIAKIVS